MTAMNKREWRALLRSRHEGADARDAQSALLCQHILNSDEYKAAHVIGGYMPLPREADVLPVLRDALAQGKTLALPLCGQPPRMTLRRVNTLETLIPGAYGILEPRSDTEMIPVEQVDLLLVPLEGIDQDGYRLGKGGGYYDCLLAGAKIKTIGCALTWQWADHLPQDRWDQPLYACADKVGLHYFETEALNERKHKNGKEEEAAEDREGHQALSEG